MKTQYSVSKSIKITFYIIVATMFIGLLLSQIFFPSEQEHQNGRKQLLYEGTLFWEKPDGTKEQITAPGKYEVEPGETMVITTVLPEDYAEDSVMIRGSQQSVRFYVDKELRCVYDTKDSRPFGSESASRYVFCKTSSHDAGKELRIELLSNAERYSGIVNDIYCGDKADIWLSLIDRNGSSGIIALFILFTGIVTIIFSIALGIAYNTKNNIVYLGWCMIFGAMWMLGESKLRQIYVPNASSLATLCFVIVLASPIPILLYVDSIQQGRFRKIFELMEWVAVTNLVLSTILQFAEIADYLDTLFVSLTILVLTILTVFVTFYLDFRKGRIADYLMNVIGLLSAMVGAVIECACILFALNAPGIFLGAGMLLLLTFTVIGTIKDIRYLEDKRQLEQNEEHRKQTEAMSLQLIRTLSGTIESKDEYTRGHSYRVAEYSALIAKEMGWDDEEVKKLRNAAYLHDIGKIGIPDIIVNKPSNLLDTEYDIIKKHVTIGADILHNISLIPHAEEVARFHHERYDGKGYPQGLQGEKIPVYARIVTVADSYDAMNSKRIYRNTIPHYAIRQEIIENRGKRFDPVIADAFLKLLDDGRIQQLDKELHLSEGAILPELEMSGTEDACRFIYGVLNTMNSQREVQNTDFLTGLPLRNFGEKLIAQKMQECDGCLIFIDLDNLKKINDIYGHKAGDRILTILGETISECAKEAVTCRLGGDEFLIFVPELSKEEADELIEAIFGGFAKKKEKNIEFNEASLSSGLCMTNKGDSFSDCYAKADKALYYIKQNGKSGYSFYHQIEDAAGDKKAAEIDLDKIALALQKNGSYEGALGLENRQFSKIYEYVSNLGERYHHKCHLVMITIDDVSDKTMFIEDIEQALQCMEMAIRGNIRNVDICTRYSSMQYLVILIEAGTDKIPMVMDRIFSKYYKLYGRDDFSPRYEFRKMLEDK